MKRIIPFALALTLAVSTAWAEDREQAQRAQQDQQQQQRDDSAAAAAPDAAAQPAAGRERAQQDAADQDPTQAFLQDAWSCNQFEVQLGQLAAQRAQDDQIKQFARTMVQDHTKANQQLKQVAQSANIQLKEELDAVHQAKLEKYQKCEGREFGRKYINGQAAGHIMSVLEFTWQSQNAQNEQVKQYASKALPKLEEHLRHATEIARAQAGGGEARPAGARERGSTDDAAAQPGARSGQEGQGRGTASDRTGASDAGSDASGAGRSEQPGASETPGAGQSDASGTSDAAGKRSE